MTKDISRWPNIDFEVKGDQKWRESLLRDHFIIRPIMFKLLCWRIKSAKYCHVINLVRHGAVWGSYLNNCFGAPLLN